MSTTLSPDQIIQLATDGGYEVNALRAVMLVETPGYGYSKVTGKILIQFEPAWFKRKYEDWQSHTGVWIYNGVGNQTEEWKAFNDAFANDKDAAMQATSIGIMQVMGFHYRSLGFNTVGEMWDFAKVSEYNQLTLGIRFIKMNPKLDAALKTKNWAVFAFYYNGSGYKELAKREGSLPYDQRLANAYQKLNSHV